MFGSRELYPLRARSPLPSARLAAVSLSQLARAGSDRLSCLLDSAKLANSIRSADLSSMGKTNHHLRSSTPRRIDCAHCCCDIGSPCQLIGMSIQGLFDCGEKERRISQISRERAETTPSLFSNGGEGLKCNPPHASHCKHLACLDWHKPQYSIQHQFVL